MINPVNKVGSFLNKSVADVSDDKLENNQTFSQLLKNKIKDVNDLQIKSDNITRDFALGKVENIHDVTIATEKAKLALNLTLSIQNKVVDAYKEIMRMQV